MSPLSDMEHDVSLTPASCSLYNPLYLLKLPSNSGLNLTVSMFDSLA